MPLPEDSMAMMAEIDMDYDEALTKPIKDSSGHKMWRDVTYAVEAGFRPLMLDVTLPKGQGPFPLVVFIHGGAWFVGHPTISNPKYRKLDHHNRLLEAISFSKLSHMFDEYNFWVNVIDFQQLKQISSMLLYC